MAKRTVDAQQPCVKKTEARIVGRFRPREAIPISTCVAGDPPDCGVIARVSQICCSPKVGICNSSKGSLHERTGAGLG